MEQNANLQNFESERKLVDLKTVIENEKYDKKSQSSFMMQPPDSVNTGVSSEYNNNNFNLNDPLNCKTTINFLKYFN